MFRLFRKIRFNLLKKDKLFNYMAYALGEIILVVIGILIALQVNLANEERKLDNLRHSYYNQLIFDLSSEINSIDRYLKTLDSSTTSYQNYQSLFESSELEPMEVLLAFRDVKFEYEYLTFNTNTFETLESTGNIELIPTKIRDKLIELIRFQEFVSTYSSGNLEGITSSFQKVYELGYSPIGEHIYFRHSKLGEQLNIMNNVPEIVLRLDAAFFLKNTYEEMLISDLNKMRLDCEELIRQIDAELKIKK